MPDRPLRGQTWANSCGGRRGGRLVSGNDFSAGMPSRPSIPAVVILSHSRISCYCPNVHCPKGQPALLVGAVLQRNVMPDSRHMAGDFDVDPLQPDVLVGVIVLNP